MSREYPQMKLRMPPELKESIESAAKESGRSMNAEIIYRLHHSLTDDLDLSDDSRGEYDKEFERIHEEFERMRKENADALYKLAYKLKIHPDVLDEDDLP